MTDSDYSVFNDIMTKFDADWCAGEEMRTSASNDIYFAMVSQWDDWLQQFTTLQYRGQFDIVKPVVRKLVAEMRQNPISVKYKPIDTANPDAADTLMGMYRTDMRASSSKTAVDIAAREQIICGCGAWRLCTEYEDQNPTSNNQIIRRKPIHEAYNHVVWDSNAREIDKSDARHVTVIVPLTVAGWDAFAEKEGLDADDKPSFSNPDSQWYFPWLTREVLYIGEHYKVAEKKEKVFIYMDPMTQEPVSYFKKDIQDVIEEIAAKGYEKVGERMVSRKRVYKYLVTGDRILKGPTLIAGAHLPIVPVMGDWGFAGDKEVFEGIVRGTKDMQRARNMVMSFNMDIVGRSPRRKPIFYPEQIAGYEHMYGSNDDYPFYYMNMKSNGQVLPQTPIQYLEDAQIPPGNQLVYDAMTQAISDVSSSGADAAAAQGGNPAAFDTVNQINQRADMETFVFLDNMATAMRRDGEIYASIANDIYDTSRSVTLTAEDGTETDVKLFEMVFDLKTGMATVLNDISGQYQTYTDVGPSFKSMKDASRAEIKELITAIGDPTNPMFQILMYQYMALWDGASGDMMREYANKQLLLMGLKKPETPEEEQTVKQAQQAQSQQQDPNMVAAQAQLGLAQAENKKADNETAQVQIKAFTAQQEAQAQQAVTILNLAKAKDIDNSAVLDGLKLLSDVTNQQYQNIPGMSAA